MRIAKVMLGLSGLLLMSMVLVSFQAAAHPTQSDDGLANALGNTGAPVGSHISDVGRANGGFDGEGNGNAGVAIANNPLCPRHP